MRTPRSASYLVRLETTKQVAYEYRSGEPLPTFAYTPADDRLWASMLTKLLPLHRRRASRHVVDAAEILLTAHDVLRVPQPAVIAQRVRSLTGFRFEPVPGLIPQVQFLTALSDFRYPFIPFQRDPKKPRFSPIPDYLHEAQHGLHLCVKEFAELYALFGKVALRHIYNTGRLQQLGNLFFYSLEVGLVSERGEPRAVGAALLSSIDELSNFENARIESFDPRAMENRVAVDSHAQEVLFLAPGIDEFIAILTKHLSAF